MLIQSKFRSGGTTPAATVAGLQPSATSYYPEGAVIYAQGDRAGALYRVEFGVVRICRLTADGRRQINAFLFQGEFFGFEAGAEHEFYAESVNGAGVRMLRTTGDLGAAGLLAVALQRLARAQQHQVVLGRRSATEKMAAFILEMSEGQDESNAVVLPMQRNDIADYLGLTFETVSRALRVLREGGIIRVPSVHQIEVLDRVALEEMAA